MKQQSAFVEKNKMLKGGLHCHTTRSDGQCTPEEVIRYHFKNGYDFLAITDHRLYNYKNFAPEVPITIIPGMEFDNTFEFGKGFRTFHTVCIGLEKVSGNGYEQDESFDSWEERKREDFQEYLDEFHRNGNMIFLCHPEWSSTSARYFEDLKGIFAMEIWNSGCAMECGMDTDAAFWDEILGQGKCIYGVATDDGHALSHHCNGWVMVNADNRVDAILEALQNGAFYSSCGPEIYDFYVQDGKAIIECSPASQVRFHCDMHPTRIVFAEDEAISHAEIDLKHDWSGEYKYIRATIIDKHGKYAWTNPIFLETKKTNCLYNEDR